MCLKIQFRTFGNSIWWVFFACDGVLFRGRSFVSLVVLFSNLLCVCSYSNSTVIQGKV